MDEPKIAGTSPIRVELEAGKKYAYCTCGLSVSQPFCDGAHSGTEFKPIVFTAEESKAMHVCCCKRTCNAPQCDGSHNNLDS